MRAARVVTLTGALSGALACTSSSTPCAAPGSGSFSLALTFTQSLPVAIYCSTEADGSVDLAASCADAPHPLAGVTLKVQASGSTATVTGAPGGQSWTCAVTGPDSAPASLPDGSTGAGTGCYLLLTCAHDALGDAGAADLQVQILARSTTDVMVLAHDDGQSCCSDQYQGTWQ